MLNLTLLCFESCYINSKAAGFDRCPMCEGEPILELGNTWVKPDFYLPEQKLYVEFWGLVTNAEYAERMRWKLRLYQQFQVRLLSLFSEDLGDLEKSLTKGIPH